MFLRGSAVDFDKEQYGLVALAHESGVPLGQAGMRPSALHDQRTASTYIFGAICPSDGKGAGLVLPLCNMPIGITMSWENSSIPGPSRASTAACATNTSTRKGSRRD